MKTADAGRQPRLARLMRHRASGLCSHPSCLWPTIMQLECTFRSKHFIVLHPETSPIPGMHAKSTLGQSYGARIPSKFHVRLEILIRHGES